MNEVKHEVKVIEDEIGKLLSNPQDLIVWFGNLPLVGKLFGLLSITGILGFIWKLPGLIVNTPKVYSLIKGVALEIQTVEKAEFVERQSWLVDFQINLCLVSHHNDAYIESIYLVNKDKFDLLYNEPGCLHNEPDNNLPSHKACVTLASEYTNFNFTVRNEDDFMKCWLENLRKYKKQINLKALKIAEDSLYCFTIAGRLKGKTNTSSYSRIPTKSWKISIRYRSGKKVGEVEKELS